jgi:hypothetical protein
VQVHSNNMIASGHGNHICYQLGCDRHARLILFVNPGIRETGNDSGNAPS